MTTRSYLSIARKNAVAPFDSDVPSENKSATAAGEPVKKKSTTPTPFSTASNRSSDPITPARTDPTASISNTTQATTANSNTACTSPLTVTSLEQQAAGLRPPVAVVEQPSGVPVPQPTTLGAGPAGGADGLIRGMAAMGLGHALPQSLPGPALPNMAALPPPKSQGNGQHDVWGSQQGRPNNYHHVVGPARTPPTEHDNRKLFVGGLPTDVTVREFTPFFEQFGEVIDSVVMHDRQSRRSRGFGFVTFASEEDAMSLLTAIPGKTGYVTIKGKQCEVKASTPKVDDGSPSKFSGQHSHHHPTNSYRGYNSYRRQNTNGSQGSKTYLHGHHSFQPKRQHYEDDYGGGDHSRDHNFHHYRGDARNYGHMDDASAMTGYTNYNTQPGPMTEAGSHQYGAAPGGYYPLSPQASPYPMYGYPPMYQGGMPDGGASVHSGDGSYPPMPTSIHTMPGSPYYPSNDQAQYDPHSAFSAYDAGSVGYDANTSIAPVPGESLGSPVAPAGYYDQPPPSQGYQYGINYGEMYHNQMMGQEYGGQPPGALIADQEVGVNPSANEEQQ